MNAYAQPCVYLQARRHPRIALDLGPRPVVALLVLDVIEDENTPRSDGVDQLVEDVERHLGRVRSIFEDEIKGADRLDQFREYIRKAAPEAREP
ncbi:MAG TPA: hypothetical protein VK285_08275, partial [Gaiellaceae bacterium]|nr:hypothetical protein [Gaiellaceae bacterium]